ncbi:hypothetical protein PVA8_31 [Vibrio phage PVA8]|nr:hypothetical protein [Vibrio phage PC-Liy1]URQ03017.1 hypothetical protein PVA8_31 [Vibrio phage PVA8]WBM58753.1 hypothetical protein vBValMPVA8_31 [Vibrio phage vB_ValM_PVA8]
MTLAHFPQDELPERFDFKMPDEPETRKTHCKVTEEKDKNIFKIIMFWFFMSIFAIGVAAFFGFFSKIEIGDRYYLLQDVGWERSQSVLFGIEITDVNYAAERVRYKYINLDAVDEKEMAFSALKRSYVPADSVEINQTMEKTK